MTEIIFKETNLIYKGVLNRDEKKKKILTLL